jgi:hypothetical protein
MGQTPEQPVETGFGVSASPAISIGIQAAKFSFFFDLRRQGP